MITYEKELIKTLKCSEEEANRLNHQYIGTHQFSCEGNPLDRGAYCATVHGIIRHGHVLVTKNHHYHSQYICFFVF